MLSDSQRIRIAAAARLDRVNKVAASVGKAIEEAQGDQPRWRRLEARYLEACQERAKLQRLLAVMAEKAA
jgi:hypothetical protein